MNFSSMILSLGFNLGISNFSNENGNKPAGFCGFLDKMDDLGLNFMILHKIVSGFW